MYRLILLILLTLATQTWALINIPEDYPTIQQGIDAAIPGDTILIWPGTYVEELEINQKNLTLGSLFITTGDTSFISNTLLDGDSTYHILTCYGPHGISVAGLTFTHGFGDWILDPYFAWGGAVTIFDRTDVELHGCRFLENYGKLYPVLYGEDSCSTILDNCVFRENSGEERATLIRNTESRFNILRECSFEYNECREGPMVIIGPTDYGSIESCRFNNNLDVSGYQYAGTHLLGTAARILHITDCEFRNNYMWGNPSLIEVLDSDTAYINNCLIDSITINHGRDYQLVDLSGGNANLVLNNIRITNNYSFDGDGFGISLAAGASQSVTADSIFFINNHAEFEWDGAASCGVGIGSENNGPCTASNIFVLNNSALRTDIVEHPDIYLSGIISTNFAGGTVSVNHVVKENNVIDFIQSGLGMRIAYRSPNQTVFLDDITIHDNVRLHTTPDDEYDTGGSGLIVTPGDFIRKLEINNLRLYNQHHTVYAAGINAWADTIIIRNSHISDCGNGAIWLRSDHFELSNVLVHDCWNTRGEPSSHIVSGRMNESALIRNCAIVDNYADYGSALRLWTESPEEKTVLIVNCIIDNSCPWGTDLDYQEDANINLTVRYSNIDGGWEGVGNIDVDPMFTDPENDDYTFLEGSPCIDAGNPDPAYNDPEDPDHTGWPLWPSQGTLRNDIGCYGGPGAIELWDYQEDVPGKPGTLVQPATIALRQNYPNPFNPTTTIEFTLPFPQEIQLIVYNILGQQVQLLADRPYSAGVHQIAFDGRMLASGIYIYRLQSDDQMLTRKMVLVK